MATSSADQASETSRGVERGPKTFFVVLLVGVLSLLAFVGYQVYEAVREADEAEHHLQAVDAVVHVLIKFIDKNGRWPRDLAELRAEEAYDGWIYDWPKDEIDVLKRVQIRFDADLTQVADANVESFPWVSWPESVPVFKRVVRARIRDLIAVAQAKVDGKKPKM